MKRSLALSLLLVLAFAFVGAEASAQKKPKIKDTVTFAKTWEAAVAEAKMLNVPIVLHSHGFY